MNTICIKPRISEGEDGSVLLSSDFFVYVTILLLNSLTVFSLATLLTTAVFHASSNDIGTLHLFIWGEGTGVFNFNSLSGLPTDSIINSPDKSVVFTSFSDRTNFLVSFVPSPKPDTVYMVTLEDRFDTKAKKRGTEK